MTCLRHFRGLAFLCSVSAAWACTDAGDPSDGFGAGGSPAGDEDGSGGGVGGAGGEGSVVFPGDSDYCPLEGAPALLVRVPQAVEGGECSLEMWIESEENFDTVVASLECEADLDDCVCVLDSIDAPFGPGDWVVARRGDEHWGRVSPFQHEEPCSQQIHGEFLATFEDFWDVNFLTREISRVEEAAFAVADRTGCSGDEECAAMPLGSKACGGPTGYIVYSQSSTDEEWLSELADAATEAEEAFNAENEVSSNCAYNEPPELACEESVCVRVPAQ